MLVAIFYARFLLERGPSIIDQHPAGFITTGRTTDDDTESSNGRHKTKSDALSWSDIVSYIIPAYELCNRPLSISRGGFSILGFPVSLEDEKYDRNRFTFNVCFVVPEGEDVRPWEVLVRKTARFFTALEVEDGILRSKELPSLDHLDGNRAAEQQQDGIGKILERIFAEINRYGETCIRVQDLHVLNLRLFHAPRSAPAQKVTAWDVPLLIRSLPRPEEWTWDLTLERIHSHIDGVNHVQRIAELADVELRLTIKAIRELLYHERVMILDLFHFQASYMLTSDFTFFVANEAMQDECCKYIAIDPSTNPLFDPANRLLSSSTPHHHQFPPPTRQTLLTLYRDLTTAGLTIHSFLLTHQHELSNIDVRRFITFGTIKGFLRRIHKFALAVDSSVTGSLQPSPGGSYITATPNPIHQNHNNNNNAPKPKPSAAQAQEEFDRAWRRAALSSGWATPPTELPPLPPGFSSTQQQVDIRPRGTNGSRSPRKENERGKSGLPDEGTTLVGGFVFDPAADDEKLRRFLDGRHCLDQICVEMHWSEKRVVENLSSGRFGEVVFFSK